MKVHCNPTSQEIGSYIRRLRTLKGYSSLKSFADALEITEAALSKIENGITDIRYSRFCQIAKELQIDIEIIFKNPADLITKKLTPPRKN